MAKQLSAGLLIYRQKDDSIEIFATHPGGPFWSRKDLGAWGIPKGVYEESEDPLQAAYREFKEETGQEAPAGEPYDLGEVKMKSGKVIHAWALKGEVDEKNIKSNTAEIEWPPRSGKKIQIPEIDRAEWFDLATAIQKLHPVQAELVQKLIDHLGLKVEQAAMPPEQSSLF